jgi:hypothetical protein
MEDLTEAPHASAWITTDAGSLTLVEITLLYSRLDRRSEKPAGTFER